MESSPMQYTAPLVVPSYGGPTTATVVLRGHGDLDKVVVAETAVPTKLEDDHIELAAFYHGLNFTDNYLRLGIIRNTDFPVIMGSECSGIIARIGADVFDLKEGDRVLVLRMHAGLFRRVLHVPRRYCYQLADHVSLRNGIALGLSFVVAHTCLFELGRLRPGQIVHMPSIGGGVGTAVVQLARTISNVIVTGTASGCKREKLLALGVNHVFNNDESYMVKTLYPRGADIIINCNGGSDIEEYISLLKPYGRMINIGSNNSVKGANILPWPKPKWDDKGIQAASIVNKNSVITGLDIGYDLENNQHKVRTILDDAFELMRLELVKPIIHNTLDMERAADGLEIMCRGENFGKVILHKLNDR